MFYNQVIPHNHSRIIVLYTTQTKAEKLPATFLLWISFFPTVQVGESRLVSQPVVLIQPVALEVVSFGTCRTPRSPPPGRSPGTTWQDQQCNVPSSSRRPSSTGRAPVVFLHTQNSPEPLTGVVTWHVASQSKSNWQ